MMRTPAPATSRAVRPMAAVISREVLGLLTWIVWVMAQP